MWLRVVVIYTYLISPALCHLSEDETTPANRVEQYCERATNCVHDTIRICGKYETNYREFMDLCDMLEYNCDNTLEQLFVHVDDKPGCPEKTGKIGYDTSVKKETYLP